MKKRIKKIRLKKLGKICLTFFIICMCPAIYTAMKLLGQSVMTKDFSLIVVVIGWLWLIAGQVATLSLIWEE